MLGKDSAMHMGAVCWCCMYIYICISFFAWGFFNEPYYETSGIIGHGNWYISGHEDQLLNDFNSVITIVVPLACFSVESLFAWIHFSVECPMAVLSGL